MTELPNTTELPNIGETYNDDLARAIGNLKVTDSEIRRRKADLDSKKDLVVIEMKKIGKDFLRIQLDGEFWEVEIKKSEEKLRFARSKK